MSAPDAPDPGFPISGSDATDPYAAWMGRAVMAFPTRWRESRGAELVEVSRALSGAEDGQRPSARELADVIRGGLAVRLRDRPPLWRRLAYHWAWQPVPRRYWGWMRDDLRSRSLGVRFGLRSMIVPIAVIGFLWAVGDQSRLSLVVATIFIGAVATLQAWRQARRFRTRMRERIGFDLAAYGALAPASGTPPWLPAPPPPAAPPVLAPAPRIPIRHFAWPLACWATMFGAGLIAGAALPNGRIAWGPFSYAPDPNSPLSASEVTRWSTVVALAAMLLASMVLTFAWVRYRTLAIETAHPVNALFPATRRALWALTVSATLIEQRLGRPLSMPDLVVGERWQLRWGDREDHVTA